jgi:hypothetical protein
MSTFNSLLRNIALAMLVLAGSISMSAKTLYLRTTNVADQRIELGEIKNITFGDASVFILLADGSSLTTELTNFKSIRTDQNGTQGTSGVSTIDATTADGEWLIYNTNGQFIGKASEIAKDVGSLTSNLTPGVYIVKSKTQTLKLIAR